jgi:hypothetical protein
MKYLSVKTDEFMVNSSVNRQNPDECNADEYNKLYSSVPSNISIYSSVTCNQ